MRGLALEGGGAKGAYQAGAIKALNLPEVWFNEQNKIYTSRKNKVIKLAQLLNCKVDKNSLGMFVWAKLPENTKSAEAMIEEQLQNNHIFITPGSIFGSNGSNYIRFSLCLSEELIDEAILRVKQSQAVLHSL